MGGVRGGGRVLLARAEARACLQQAAGLSLAAAGRAVAAAHGALWAATSSPAHK